MRVAVVFFPAYKGDQTSRLAQALAKGIESQGHQVDVIDGQNDQEKKLVIYQYIAVGTAQISFFGKISDKISHFLASQGTVQGKKGFAFVVKRMFGTQRALLRLMSAMEKEGIIVKSSEVFSSTDQSQEMGRRLHISLQEKL